jgi:hypothetical protein
VTALLRLSRLIDSITELIGKFAMWLILAAVLISAGNAIMRKAFDIGSNAFLEIQWYLFAGGVHAGFGLRLPAQCPCAHRLSLGQAVASAPTPSSTPSASWSS